MSATTTQPRAQLPFDLSSALLAAILALAGAGLALSADALPSPFLLIAIAIIALPIGLVLALRLPAWPVTAAFVGGMTLMHLYKSVVIFPVAGLELHPRELLFGGYLAFTAIYFLRGRALLHYSPMHFWFGLYALYFVYIALNGVLRQPDMTNVIAEFRYAMFLGAYPLFVLTIASRRELYGHLSLILVLATALATLGLAFFAYTLLTGNVINEQNAYGEYVRRQIGPFLLQSVRPNGHLFFEIAVVVLSSLLLLRTLSFKVRALLLAGIALFLAAILITMMRTAWVSLFLSLAMLAFLLLPRRLQYASAALGLGCGMVAVALFSVTLSEAAAAWMTDQGISLQGRFVEIRGALRALAPTPLLGTGMGSTFTDIGLAAHTSQVSYAQREFLTLHNVWMYFLFKGGLAGFTLAATAIAGMLFQAWRTTTASTGFQHALLRGLLAAWMGQLIASLAMPRLTYPMGAVLMALMAAVFFITARNPTKAKA